MDSETQQEKDYSLSLKTIRKLTEKVKIKFIAGSTWVPVRYSNIGGDRKKKKANVNMKEISVMNPLFSSSAINPHRMRCI